MEDKCHPRELQLMPKPPPAAQWAASPPVPNSPTGRPAIDLNLAIGAKTFSGAEARGSASSAQALRWQAAEQNRLAAMEKAYAEQVRELTRREMELAEQEFERARAVWRRAQEDLEGAERMREMATKKTGLVGSEVTCHACRRRFRP